MITLDPILLAAQDSLERHPIVNINSASFADPIPFEGQIFNTSSLDEQNPDIISTVSGKLVCIVERDWDLILLITNDDKTEWFEYNIYHHPLLMTVMEGSIVELLTNNLGIIFIKKTTGDYILQYKVVSDTGTILVSAVTIFSSSDFINSPSVELLANDTYVLVYVIRNSSNEYSIQKRTSSDFLTWSSPTTISPSGLNNLNRIDNLVLKQLASGEIFLLFDYLDGVSGDEELINLYSIQSLDNGVSWEAPVKLTDYSIYGTSALHPSLAERDDGSIEIAFQEEKSLLKMNNSDWLSGDTIATNVYFNSFDNKLYVINGYSAHTSGNREMWGMVVIDVPTWSIDKSYHGSSTPSLYPPIFEDQVHMSWNGDGYIVAFQDFVVGTSHVDVIMVLNVDLDTITYYIFDDIPAFGWVKNIDVPSPEGGSLVTELRILPEEPDRLYVIFREPETYTKYFSLGYIELLSPIDPITEMYEFTWLFKISYGSNLYNGIYPARLYLDQDLILDSNSPVTRDCNLRIFNFAGSLVYSYNYLTEPGFHKNGIQYPILINGHVYGGTTYESLYGQGSRYGLMDIELSTGNIRYHRPSWGTYDNYYLGVANDMEDGRILFSSRVQDGYGITIFDIASETWVLFDTDTLSGLPSNRWFDVDYDPIEKIIFAVGWSGLVAFSEEGIFQQLNYFTGTNDGTWSYSDIAILVNGYANSQPSLVIDSDDVLTAVWIHRDETEYSIYWGQEVAEKNLTDYLLNDTLSIKWDVGSISSMDFSLSHGHLFDRTNTMSLLSLFLKKGRKIDIQFGESISGVDYYQNQGSFIIQDAKLSYSKGTYPKISVTCEDNRSVLKQCNIVTTDYFSEQAPDVILSSVVEDHGNVDSSDIDFPVLVGGYALSHQFIDQDIEEVIVSILDHFNYFFYIDVDGKYTAKRFDLFGSVSHSYTGAELINYTPDDSYSNFLNRVIVKGEGLYELEVILPVEIVGSLTGTVGWWGGTEIKRVYYSDDREKKCRNPYLEILVSIQEFEIFTIQGGGRELISDTDANEYWVEITIESPNLVALIIGVVTAILAIGAVAITCVVCGPYIFALTILSQILAYMLGTIAQYDYKIWASPIGETKQTFQASADDLVFQRQLNGLIVSNEIDDPFCYTLSNCQVVADNELTIVMAQRNRVSFKKIAHLQDEIGDIIQILHPYTELNLNIFVTSLVRSYQKGDGIFDTIEGWLL